MIADADGDLLDDGSPFDADSADAASTVVSKWKEAAVAGFQAVPDVLLRFQSRLGLDAADVIILLNITMHWWEADDLPYPAPSMIARRMGMSTRAVEKRLAALQERGFVKRGPRERRNSGRNAQLSIRRFDPAGLVEKLRPPARLDLAGRPAAKHVITELGVDEMASMTRARLGDGRSLKQAV